nr:hypothetical protein [Tanacetum cinerariifolium]
MFTRGIPTKRRVGFLLNDRGLKVRGAKDVDSKVDKFSWFKIEFVLSVWLIMAGKDDDSSRPKYVVGSSSDLNFSFSDPLYLHPNDTSGTPIVTIKLTGTENYKMWSIIMTFALRNHNRLGFIYGSCKRDSSNPETYDKVDDFVVFNLYKNINSLNNNGSTLVDYYNNLNSLWKQFDAMFLMGLDESYLAIRSNLLTREPLPNVKTAFSVISGEESHRNVTSIRTTKPVATTFVAKTFDNKKRFNNNFKGSGSNSNFNNRGPNPNLKCTNCNKIGHTVDRCFELVGYPAGYVKRNFNSNSRPVTSNNASANVHSNGVSSNNATTSNSYVSLSSEKLARLVNLLNENGVSIANANMA